MKFLRKHIILICALFTLIAVGCYEGYWILRMYDTEKTSVKSIISSSVTEADTEEYLGRLKKKLGRQDTLLVSAQRPAVKPKIVSMTLDSLSGKISEVSVSNIDNRELKVSHGNHRPDVDKV